MAKLFDFTFCPEDRREPPDLCDEEIEEEDEYNGEYKGPEWWE